MQAKFCLAALGQWKVSYGQDIKLAVCNHTKNLIVKAFFHLERGVDTITEFFILYTHSTTDFKI